MAQRLIYHWKHGWIPLDHYAALSKAHGRESGAKLLMGRLGITGDDGKSTHLEKHLEQKARAAHPGNPAAPSVPKGTASSSGKLDWQPHTIAGDGTRYGDAKAAKVKQAYKAGNKTVIIETPMTKDQTKGLLADIGHVVDKANAHGLEVTFHVPSGDGRFRRSRSGGTTGAYVYKNSPTIHINPKIAAGDNPTEQAFGHNFAAAVPQQGKFMPANQSVSGRQYVLTHELGHVIDHTNSHTAMNNPTDLIRTNKQNLSQYGNSSISESYAEAFAQWVHGGPDSNPAADAYARRYGWLPPKTT